MSATLEDNLATMDETPNEAAKTAGLTLNEGMSSSKRRIDFLERQLAGKKKPTEKILYIRELRKEWQYISDQCGWKAAERHEHEHKGIDSITVQLVKADGTTGDETDSA